MYPPDQRRGYHGQFVVEADGREVQRLAIKGLGVGRLPFTSFVEHLCMEAPRFDHWPMEH